tara:strand:+ start:800 stop:949 length:150 start_codon:yes stop_codon:yes gene_type:complete
MADFDLYLSFYYPAALNLAASLYMLYALTCSPGTRSISSSESLLMHYPG